MHESTMTGRAVIEPHAPLRLVVTGANGFIGSRLVTTALADGVEVRTFSRSPEGVPASIPATHRFVGRLPDDPPTGLFENGDVVVHCAAWVGGARAEAEAVNVRGTLRLAESAARAGARAFIFLSTQSARAGAASEYGRTKYAAEQALVSRFGDAPLDVVVLRLGLVTGPGTRGLYRRLANLARRSPLIPIVGGGAPVQPIHLDDLCRAILRCARQSSVLRGRVLHLGWPNGISLARFLGALAEARSGRRKPILTVPLAPVALLVRLAETLGVRLPITSENLQGVSHVEPMDTRADMDRLGVPERNLDEILRDDLAVTNAVAREAERIGRYLVGCAPSPPLAARYARAVALLGIDIAADERRAWRLINRFPRVLRLVDAGLALAKPNGTIRHRLHTMLAILEASPEHCDAFLPVAFGVGDRLVVAAVALRAGAAGAAGLVLVHLLGVKSS
jgi:nucleoside-diphosphate-sugar epimerase